MTLTFASKAILAIDDKKKSLCQMHTIGVCVSNCKTDNLTEDSKAMTMLYNLQCNLQTIGNCALGKK